jgi:hypothetical protein
MFFIVVVVVSQKGCPTFPFIVQGKGLVYMCKKTKRLKEEKKRKIGLQGSSLLLADELVRSCSFDMGGAISSSY